ncbi:hypothetical protein LCL89_04100 [Halobacillus yeomjeoni]|uniref:Uncharacterized protein n=1 Tax=Halobacillus yeomjeoni TaxID=311194 RepID=A0A931MUB6_9BACI|nr:hypothetical protein [Halobacillus yeomjeoni]MBH0229365.1 hypothetical protein [Halobacillus yeomjeoni]MCA0983230.1 hypothetical protein [Halobacillus yeomjeoni]
MDAKERLSGQKVEFDCPYCNYTMEIAAQVIFEDKETVTCPNCDSDIYLENSEALSKIEKQWKGLKKWTRS